MVRQTRLSDCRLPLHLASFFVLQGIGYCWYSQGFGFLCLLAKIEILNELIGERGYRNILLLHEQIEPYEIIEDDGALNQSTPISLTISTKACVKMWHSELSEVQV